MYRRYTVSQKDGMWYAHLVGFPWIPIIGSFRKTKRGAQVVAAQRMALPLKEYMGLKEAKGE